MKLPFTVELATAIEVHALPAVTGLGALCLALEVGQHGRHAAAEVVVRSALCSMPTLLMSP